MTREENNNTEVQETIIRPGRLGGGMWQDLWRYRELFFFLAWRDILVRYKQTLIGVAWCLLKPFVTMVIFSVVFGNFARLPSEGMPYPVFVFAALIPWQFFSNALTESSNSLVVNANLMSKVYFPRMIVPVSSVVVSLVDLVVSFALFVAIMAWYGHVPTVRFLLLPVFLLPAFMAAVGCGLWFAALNVAYRDFRIIVPFVVQLGLFVSPVGFSTALVPEQWRLLYFINPLTAVIDGFRWSVSRGDTPLEPAGLLIAFAVSGALLLSGVWFFHRSERTFADSI